MNAYARGLAPPDVQKVIDENRVNLPGEIEVIWQPLYDYQVCAAAATASQTFFGVGTTQGRTLVATNMTLGSQIPKGQLFITTGIQVEFYPGGTIETAAAINPFADDVYAFYRSGALNFTIGSKSYALQGNLMKFAPVNRLGGFAAVDSAAGDTDILYATATGREFAVRNLPLESSQNFSVEIIGRLALPSTVAGTVGVTLNGWLARNAQ